MATKKQLEAKLRRLMRATNWLCGLGKDFEPPESMRRKDGTMPGFWYRTEFCRRGGVKWDAKKRRHYV